MKFYDDKMKFEIVQILENINFSHFLVKREPILIEIERWNRRTPHGVRCLDSTIKGVFHPSGRSVTIRRKSLRETLDALVCVGSVADGAFAESSSRFTESSGNVKQRKREIPEEAFAVPPPAGSGCDLPFFLPQGADVISLSSFGASKRLASRASRNDAVNVAFQRPCL